MHESSTWRKILMNKEHISTTRKKRSIENLEARVIAMSAIVQKGEIPPEFDIYKSDERIAKWEDQSLGITKITVRIARDNYPQLWSEIQTLKASLKAIAERKDIKNLTKKTKTKSSIIELNKNSKKIISTLTNELIMLRVAYMELLNAVEQDKHKNRVISATIKRHYAHHGLQHIVSNKK